MPVIRTQYKTRNFEPLRPLWEELARELQSGNEFGQPLVLVESFPRTGLDGYTVVWDKFGTHDDTGRSEVVSRAVEAGLGEGAKKRIGFAVGMTIPEAVGSEVLRFEVTPLLRSTDSISWDQCRDALLGVGASILSNPARPRLFLPDREEAGKYIAELVRRLPGSEPVWNVSTLIDPFRPYRDDE